MKLDFPTFKYWEFLDLCQFPLRKNSQDSTIFLLLDNSLLFPQSILIISNFAPLSKILCFFQRGIAKPHFYYLIPLPILKFFFHHCQLETFEIHCQPWFISLKSICLCGHQMCFQTYEPGLAMYLESFQLAVVKKKFQNGQRN